MTQHLNQLTPETFVSDYRGSILRAKAFVADVAELSRTIEPNAIDEMRSSNYRIYFDTSLEILRRSIKVVCYRSFEAIFLKIILNEVVPEG